ncbi:hypothetical protein FRC08_005221 [Ceratobasidium sp. 394]|nr:hypothetical protein FRC08_005221 [Ceratobasidium sp. 394]
MRSLSALLVVLATSLATGFSSSSEELDGRCGRFAAFNVVAETSPPKALTAAMLKVPIVTEDNPLQVIPGLVQGEILPSLNLAPSQGRILNAGVQPATDAFLQSSLPPTDIPPVPAKPSPPSRPKLTTFFITISGAPVTRTILDTTTLTQTITLPVPPPPPSPSPTIIPPENVWNAPADFADLDCFGILKYGFGRSNLKVVHGIPPSASASVSSPAPTGTLEWTKEMRSTPKAR